MATRSGAMDPLFQAESDEEDIIDGTADDAPVDELAKGDLPTKLRTLMLIASSVAVFVNASMAHVTAPVAPDFLRPGMTDIDLRYGIVFASSSFTSLMTTIPVWALGKADGHGGLTLLLLAFVVWMTSALLAASAAWQDAGGARYFVMLTSRLINGLGTSCGTTAVIAVVWSAYHDDTSRSSALAGTLLFYGLGESIAPVLSGVMALSGVTTGWKATFLVLAAIIAGGALFVYLVRRQVSDAGVVLRRPTYLDEVSLAKVATDPFIFLLMMSYLLVEMAMSFSTTILPTWMRHSFTPEPEPWQIGLLLLPKPIGLLLLTPIVLDRLPETGKWRLTSTALLLTALCMLSLTLITSHQKVAIVLLPALGLGVSIAMLDGSVFPVVSNLLGLRHGASYGVIRTLNATALHAAFTLGPFFSSLLAQLAGYDWAYYSMGMVLAVYCPFLIILKPFDDHFHSKHGHRRTSDNFPTTRH